ncbi:MAG: protein-glutamate O-methyltransferase CheR [Nitrospirae bacterium]|nr:protein-glutamate O-methyltransferase CheR [Candidatus Troglogloeales bacterium]
MEVVMLDPEAVEMNLLTEAIYEQYGLDFRRYAVSSLWRRVTERMQQENLATISGLQEKILHDVSCMERLASDISINVTSLFRDPGFYGAFREKIVPLLKTYPFIRIWHAGCATGEEVYSLAILLKEENLLDRCLIYATDMNEPIIEKAKSGIFPLASMKEYTRNYLKAGGKGTLSDYYTAKYDSAIFNQSLVKNTVFSRHNLAMEWSFNEFNVILCRNVMIYFNSELQEKVHDLLAESLCRFGFLGIGNMESMAYCPHKTAFEAIDSHHKLYRKV